MPPADLKPISSQRPGSKYQAIEDIYCTTLGIRSICVASKKDTEGSGKFGGTCAEYVVAFKYRCEGQKK